MEATSSIIGKVVSAILFFFSSKAGFTSTVSKATSFSLAAKVT